MDNIDSERKKKHSIDIFKIGYFAVFAIPSILGFFYFDEFVLNQPYEFPIEQVLEISEELDVDITVYNNARNEGIVKEDDIVILLKYTRDPEKYPTIEPIIYFVKANERIWERTLYPESPIFDDEILYFSKRIPINETGISSIRV